MATRLKPLNKQARKMNKSYLEVMLDECPRVYYSQNHIYTMSRNQRPNFIGHMHNPNYFLITAFKLMKSSILLGYATCNFIQTKDHQLFFIIGLRYVFRPIVLIHCYKTNNIMLLACEKRVQRRSEEFKK